MLKTLRNTLIPILLAPLMLTGCSTGSPDDEYRALMQDLYQRQAAQQESLLRQNEQFTETSKRLIEADAAARHELAEMQSTLQQEFEAERRSIDGQRDQLEAERRDIAAQRHRDPLIATAIIQATTLMVAALPLVLLVLLVRASRNEPTEMPLAELLVEDLTAEKSLLLPGPGAASPAARLEHTPSEPEHADIPADVPPEQQPEKEHSDKEHTEDD